jgi:hypothetical protein
MYVGFKWIAGPVNCKVKFTLIPSLLLFARKGEKKKREKWPEAFPKADAP